MYYLWNNSINSGNPRIQVSLCQTRFSLQVTRNAGSLNKLPHIQYKGILIFGGERWQRRGRWRFPANLWQFIAVNSGRPRLESRNKFLGSVGARRSRSASPIDPTLLFKLRRLRGQICHPGRRPCLDFRRLRVFPYTSHRIRWTTWCAYSLQWTDIPCVTCLDCSPRVCLLLEFSRWPVSHFPGYFVS